MDFIFKRFQFLRTLLLRQSIRKSVLEQSRLLDSIGTAEMEREIQKQVITVLKKTSAAMTERSGVEATMNEDDMKGYVDLVIKELKTERRR